MGEEIRELAKSLGKGFTVSGVEAALWICLRYTIDPYLKPVGKEMDQIFLTLIEIARDINEMKAKADETIEKVEKSLETVKSSEKLWGWITKQFEGDNPEAEVQASKQTQQKELIPIPTIELIPKGSRFLPYTPNLNESFQDHLSNGVNWIIWAIIAVRLKTHLVSSVKGWWFERKVRKASFPLFDKKLKKAKAEWQKELNEIKNELSAEHKKVNDLAAQVQASNQNLNEKLSSLIEIKSKLEEKGKYTAEVQARVTKLAKNYHEDVEELHDRLNNMEAVSSDLSKKLEKLLENSGAVIEMTAQDIIGTAEAEEKVEQEVEEEVGVRR